MATHSTDILALVRTLPIPSPWDRNAFIDNVARMRGRAITLVPTDTAALAQSPCGVWLKRDTDDIILHEVGTSDYHIDQIICHEVGHMLLEHDAASASVADAADRYPQLCRSVLPDLDPASVLAVLGRIDYSNDREQDAELFATMVRTAAAGTGERSSLLGRVFFRHQ